jgi:hypothetical protein
MPDHALMEEARRYAIAWVDDEGPHAAVVSSLTTGWAERFGQVGVG